MKFLRKFFSCLFVLPFFCAFPACETTTELDSESVNDSNAETEEIPSLEPTQNESPEYTPPVEQAETVQTEEPAPPVALPKVEPKETFDTGTYVECTGNNVSIRTGATTSSSVLGYAEKGTNYALLGKDGNWNKIYYRGKTAYIYESYCRRFFMPISESAKTEAVLSEGYKLLGTPYVYGAVRYHDGYGNRLYGFTADKFDCSSLTQYAFYLGAKTLLGTTTRTQVKQGKFVAKKDLKRGDCIYFTNASRVNSTGVERVGHVAIWLGEGYILHTSSDYARIEKMTTARWNYYIESRRFL